MCGLGGFGCATFAWSGGCKPWLFMLGLARSPPKTCGPETFRGRTELGNYTLFDDHRSNLGHTSAGTPGVVAGVARQEQMPS